MEALGVLAQLGLFVAVDQIAQDGMADVGHVDADLVGAARLQLTADVGVATVTLHHFPMGHGLLGIAGGDSHLLAVGGMAANGGVHGAAVLPEGAADDALVNTVHGVILQLGSQHGVCQIVLCNSQQTGGVLVDAVQRRLC